MLLLLLLWDVFGRPVEDVLLQYQGWPGEVGLEPPRLRNQCDVLVTSQVEFSTLAALNPTPAACLRGRNQIPGFSFSVYSFGLDSDAGRWFSDRCGNLVLSVFTSWWCCLKSLLVELVLNVTWKCEIFNQNKNAEEERQKISIKPSFSSLWFPVYHRVLEKSWTSHENTKTPLYKYIYMYV